MSARRTKKDRKKKEVNLLTVPRGKVIDLPVSIAEPIEVTEKVEEAPTPESTPNQEEVVPAKPSEEEKIPILYGDPKDILSRYAHLAS